MSTGAAAPQQTPPTPGLRARSLRGGVWLATREVCGILVRLGGVLLLTKLLGPADFGLYAGAVVLASLTAVIAQLGSEILLLRLPEPPTRRQIGTVNSVLLGSTAVVAAAALVVLAVVGHALGGGGALTPYRLILVSLPFNVLWAPAQATLERAFRYRALGMLELSGDVVLYATSLTLVALGHGADGAVVGICVWQAYLLVGSYTLGRPPLVLALDRAFARSVLRFGLVYSSGGWLERLEDVVMPAVVGALLGREAVGFVSLVLRFVDALSFASRATNRLALVALSSVQREPARLRRAVEDGMRLQLLALAPVLALFATVAPWVVPHLFGAQWRPSLQVLPMISTFAVVAAVAVLPMSALVVSGRESTTSRTSAARLGVLAGAGLVLVHLLHSISGYGLAKLLSAAGFLVAFLAARRLGDLSYRALLPWLAAFLPPLWAPLLPAGGRLAVWLPCAVVLALPRTRHTLVAILSELRGLLRPQA